jgi:hypothetical protein
MTDKLVDFVNKLDQDPALEKAYIEDPKRTLEENGVAPADIDILLGNDYEKIKKRLDMSGLKSILWINHSK